MIKAINYPPPEDCPVCKKGIKCPVHPDAKVDCPHHKLKHIAEREKKLEEERKKRDKEDKEDDFESVEELWG